MVNEGISFLIVGKYNEAIVYYDKALTLDPRNVDVLYNKGVALGKLGNYTQAIKYYDQALAINPNYIGALGCKSLLYIS